MPFISLADWTKPRAWRELAEQHTDHSGETYVVIGQKRDDGGEPFELLRLSRYAPKLDVHKSAVRTSIRAFDESPVAMSRRTRDLGVTRFITNKGKPIFVLEPGADVVEWTALQEGVAERELIEIIRLSEFGAAVRRKDRRALKASRQELEAKAVAFDEMERRKERDFAQMKVERDQARQDLAAEKERGDQAIDAHTRMVQKIASKNERDGEAQDKSGSMASALGTAEERGFKPVTNKPLPGSFGG